MGRIVQFKRYHITAKELQKNQDVILSRATYNSGTSLIKMFELKSAVTKRVIKH